jgi:site-specific DNA recombinase
MTLFGGMSKGERTRIKTRVRAAMSAQTATEGRFLGGRPPYGYQLADAGEHPHPGKAAVGARLHRLEPDQATAEVVARIFELFLAGHGCYAIAEQLTAEGIPSPAGYDRVRNPHRPGRAWAKSAVRAILRNPRYTGYQVWGRQRRDEVLLDVDDVAAGHVSRMRWNDATNWVWSAQPTHQPLVDQTTFKPSRPASPPDHHTAAAPPEQRHGPTCSADGYTARSASDASKANGSAARPTTAAATPPNTPPPPTSNIPSRCTCARSTWSAASTTGWPNCSTQPTSTTPARPWPPPAAATQPATNGGPPNRSWPTANAAWNATGPPWRPAPTPPSCSSGSPRSPPPGPPLKRSSGTRTATDGLTPEQVRDLVERAGGLVEALNWSDPALRAQLYEELGIDGVYGPDSHTVHVQVELGRRIGRVGGGT